jgi:hypothetical protein
MFKKYLLLSSVAAALAGCGGSSEVDLGPKNTSVATVPEAGEVFTAAWDFSDESQVADWSIEWTKSDPEAPDSELYQQVQQQALGVKAYWGDDVAKGDSVTVVGTLPYEVDLRKGTIFMSLYYPIQHLGNPWGTDPWGESAHHLGTQYVVEDADGNRGLIDSGNGSTWINSFDIDTSAFIRTDRDARPTSTNNGSDGLPIESGVWHDLKIRVGEEAMEAITDDAPDMSRIVGVGVKYNYALEKPEFLNHEYYEDGTPEQYLYIDTVALYAYDPSTDVSEETGDYVVDFSAGNKGEFGAPTVQSGTGTAVFSTVYDWLTVTPAWASAEDSFAIASDLPVAMMPSMMYQGSFSFDTMIPGDYFDDGKLAIQAFLVDVDGNKGLFPMEALSGGMFKTDEWATFSYDLAMDLEEGEGATTSQMLEELFAEGTSENFDINAVTRFGFNIFANGRDVTNAGGPIGFDNITIAPGVEFVSQQLAMCYIDLQPVKNADLTFFDWDEKGKWWGNVEPENDPLISIDESNYGRINMQTGGTGWIDLFWRNGNQLGGSTAGTTVGTNIADYSLKFDINVMSPIDAGVFKIRFHDADGVDAFYEWAPWATSGQPYSTNGWVTVEIPLADMSSPDYSLIDEEFGMAFEGADILLDFAIDNVRFETPGFGDRLHPTKSDDLVFFDWEAKGAWWGNVAAENEKSISIDGNEYGRINQQVGGTGWFDLFWRNGDSLGLPGDVVGTDLATYSLKFDINVMSPIDAGVFKIRFHDADGVDAFYEWAPWNTLGAAWQTNGWITVEIPLTEMSSPDYSLIDEEFGMAFEGSDQLLNFAIDNVRFDTRDFACPGPEPVADTSLVFFDWDEKGKWWGNVEPENVPDISIDESNYGRINMQTGSTAWLDLFWRNGNQLGGSDAGTTVGSNVADYSLKFDLNTFEPITDGVFKIRFHDADGVDAFYEWAPWAASGQPYVTNGWTTVTIPLSDMSSPDYSLIDEEFGMAFENADVLLNFAIDNVRFEAN